VKPDVSEMLAQAAQTLLVDVAPRLGAEYEQRSVAILAMLLPAVSEEFDRAAARRVEENAAMRRLFADSKPVVRDPGLRARLDEAARGAEASLSIGALTAANEALRGLLVDLHAAIEGLSTPAARALEERIWAELRASTERRRLSFAPF
jgi:hypothetical protein